MESNKTIHVIVPVYNAAPWLRRCVESLEAQTWPAMEIVLVNDGSKDGSLALCLALAGQYGNIRVCDRPNGGAAAARNTGLDTVQDGYVGFVDADDYVEPEMFAALAGALEAENADIACCGRTRDIDGVRGAPELTLPAPAGFDQAEALRRFFAFDGIEESACNKLFRAGLLADIRFRTGSVGEDILFVYDALCAARRVSHTGPGAYYHYCFETGRESASADSCSARKRAQLDYPHAIWQDVRTRFPALEPAAHAYYLGRLLEVYVTMRTVGVAPADRAYAREVRTAFYRSLGAMLTSGYLSGEKKKVAAVYALHAEQAVAAVSKAVRGALHHGKA